MKTEVIAGDQLTSEVSTPIEALNQFYYAFNHRNLDIMAQNWLHKDRVSMSNPLGNIVRGWSDIETVYQRIFNGQAKVYVEFFDFDIHETENGFLAAGRERGHFTFNGEQLNLRIRTSRYYTKNGNTWKQVHHHGSIESPELLHAYQTMVK